MYNRVFDYFHKNKLLFNKECGFQVNNSMEHALLQLINDIRKSFEKSEFTLEVFRELSKAFDTVNHDILLTKLKQYVINGINIWY